MLWKVAVLGAAGGIGQPLSLLLKQNPNIDHLSLYDIFATEGVAADISHIDTPAKVHAYEMIAACNWEEQKCDWRSNSCNVDT